MPGGDGSDVAPELRPSPREENGAVHRSHRVCLPSHGQRASARR